MSDVVKIPCSGCMESVAVNVTTGVVTAKVPANGKRGSLHVPVHVVSTEATYANGLVMWDCPRCEYPDSTYEDPAVRADLAG